MLKCSQDSGFTSVGHTYVTIPQAQAASLSHRATYGWLRPLQAQVCGPVFKNRMSEASALVGRREVLSSFGWLS